MLERSREVGKAHPIEEVGKRLRDMMSWIREARKDSSERESRRKLEQMRKDANEWMVIGARRRARVRPRARPVVGCGSRLVLGALSG